MSVQYVMFKEFCDICGICPTTGRKAIEKKKVSFQKCQDGKLHYYKIPLSEVLQYKKDHEERGILVRPTSHVCNDLKGSHTLYDTVKRQYYRIHFEKTKGFDEWVEIYLEVDKNITTLEDVLNRESVKTFFNSLMSEKEQ